MSDTIHNRKDAIAMLNQERSKIININLSKSESVSDSPGKNRDFTIYGAKTDDGKYNGIGCEIVYKSGSVYKGSVTENLRDGVGYLAIMDKKDKESTVKEEYFGWWKDDKMNGYGIYTDRTTGYRFEGKFENNNRIDIGTAHLPNGDYFLVEYNYLDDDKRATKPDLNEINFYYSDGSAYSGPCKDVKTHHDNKDSRSYGNWNDVLMVRKHGKGVYIDSLNIEYRGNFKNDVREGKGKISQLPVGDMVDKIKGNFKNNKLNGRGLIYHKDEIDNFFKYKGDFENGETCGKGRLFDYTYEGSFIYQMYIGTFLGNKKLNKHGIYLKATYLTEVSDLSDFSDDSAKEFDAEPQEEDEETIKAKQEKRENETADIETDFTIKYKGGFTNGKYDGVGCLVENNMGGDLDSNQNYLKSYKGEFKDGVNEGLGIHSNQKLETYNYHEGQDDEETRKVAINSVDYKGGWKKGKYHGFGHLEEMKSESVGAPKDIKYYIGEFNFGSKSGFIRTNDIDYADLFKATKNSKFKINKNQFEYRGQYKFNKKNGVGVVYNTKENKYEYFGNWKDDKVIIEVPKINTDTQKKPKLNTAQHIYLK